MDGNVIAFGGREMDSIHPLFALEGDAAKRKAKTAKYLNSPSSSGSFYLH